MLSRIPTPFNCFQFCSEYKCVQLNGAIFHICGNCALKIDTLKSCPVVFPCPDRVVKRKIKEQSKESMDRELKKSKMMEAVRNESYNDKIARLLTEEKKRKSR